MSEELGGAVPPWGLLHSRSQGPRPRKWLTGAIWSQRTVGTSDTEISKRFLISLTQPASTALPDSAAILTQKKYFISYCISPTSKPFV